jgi:hypothetical protein
MTILKSIPHFGRTLVLLWVGLLQPGSSAAIEAPEPPGIAARSNRTVESVVRELAARSANWVAPPAALETLEYEFVSGLARILLGSWSAWLFHVVSTLKAASIMS